MTFIEEVEGRIASHRHGGLSDLADRLHGQRRRVQGPDRPVLRRACLPGRTGPILDEFIHGSVIGRLPVDRARVFKFKHDDLDDLGASSPSASGLSNKLIVTEGVFCLEGEIIDFPRMSRWPSTTRPSSSSTMPTR